MRIPFVPPYIGPSLGIKGEVIKPAFHGVGAAFEAPGPAGRAAADDFLPTEDHDFIQQELGSGQERGVGEGGSAVEPGC